MSMHIKVEGDRIITSHDLCEKTMVNYISCEPIIFYAPAQFQSWLLIYEYLSEEMRQECQPIINSLIETVESFTYGDERDGAMSIVAKVKALD